MLPTEEITAKERSSLPLSEWQYEFLESNDDFWKLSSNGIVSLERKGKAQCFIRASCYVGQAVIGGKLLRVQEKIPGALAGMLISAGDLSAKLLKTTGVVDKTGKILKDIVEQFLENLSAYLLSGRARSYVLRSHESPLPKGKFHIGRTINLRALGRGDLLAYTSNELTADLPINRLIGLGIHAIDGIVSCWEKSTETSSLLERIRVMGVLFEDVAWPEMSRWSYERMDDCFCAVEEEARSDQVRRLLSYARLFALHFGIGPTPMVTVPVSWFVNLEKLFEDSLRHSLKKALNESGSNVNVIDWRDSKRYVFGADERGFRAKPDIALVSDSENLCVLDGKYKEFAGKPQEADVYQILVHAHTYETKTCVLVYPGESFEYTNLGTTKDERTLCCSTVRPSFLESDCVSLLNSISTLVSGELGLAQHDSNRFLA